jgi:hypothetical protein
MSMAVIGVAIPVIPDRSNSFFIYFLPQIVMAKKVTSRKAASAASKVLRDKRTSRTSKTAAGSALSQREKRRRK